MIICQHNLQFNDLPILSLPWQYCPFTTIPIHNIWTSEDIHGKKCEHFGRFSNKVSSSRSPEVNRPTRLSLLIDIGISVLIVYISQPKYQRDIEHRCARSPRPPPSSPPESLAHRSSFACPEVGPLVVSKTKGPCLAPSTACALYSDLYGKYFGQSSKF